MDPENAITLTIHHRGSPHAYTLPQSATMKDLSSTVASELHIPEENQKFLVSPKPGMLKAPFPDTSLAELLPDSIRSSPKFKITLLGSPAQEISDLNEAVSSNRRRLEARATSSSHPRISRRPPGGVHTLSSPSPDTYTFHRLLPISYLPNPDRSLQFLARLRDDPGIKFAMQKHRFSVPLLTEMNPAEHTTESSRTLGLNRNKGEVIELRLRTDAYDGYRDYRTIRKTLCHELAHCVFSEHDRDFWNLTKQIEGEVERGDWTRGGHRLTEQEFYNPQDWEEQAGREEVDERGWTGGEFVLGGLKDNAGSSGSAAGAIGTESRREILARAAEERLKKDKTRGRNPENN
ncbi:hypothetical protein Plec18167_005750 [Paecilomyces lecythidis]|uniref:WLM domain-containing protein n=1 Tax=Paecilomyces lecythidis TaxID=3004212 RepID=A0ABR3XGK7_9EURO